MRGHRVGVVARTVSFRQLPLPSRLYHIFGVAKGLDTYHEALASTYTQHVENMVYGASLSYHLHLPRAYNKPTEAATTKGRER